MADHVDLDSSLYLSFFVFVLFCIFFAPNYVAHAVATCRKKKGVRTNTPHGRNWNSSQLVSGSTQAEFFANFAA